VEGLLLGNLLVITLLTVLNSFLTFYYMDKQRYIDITTSLQALLLYLPFMYVIVHVAKNIKKTMRCKKDSEVLNYMRFSSSLDTVEERCKETEDF